MTIGEKTRYQSETGQTKEQIETSTTTVSLDAKNNRLKTQFGGTIFKKINGCIINNFNLVLTSGGSGDPKTFKNLGEFFSTFNPLLSNLVGDPKAIISPINLESILHTLNDGRWYVQFKLPDNDAKSVFIASDINIIPKQSTQSEPVQSADQPNAAEPAPAPADKEKNVPPIDFSEIPNYEPTPNSENQIFTPPEARNSDDATNFIQQNIEVVINSFGRQNLRRNTELLATVLTTVGGIDDVTDAINILFLSTNFNLEIEQIHNEINLYRSNLIGIELSTIIQAIQFTRDHHLASIDLVHNIGKLVSGTGLSYFSAFDALRYAYPEDFDDLIPEIIKYSNIVFPYDSFPNMTMGEIVDQIRQDRFEMASREAIAAIAKKRNEAATNVSQQLGLLPENVTSMIAMTAEIFNRRAMEKLLNDTTEDTIMQSFDDRGEEDWDNSLTIKGNFERSRDEFGRIIQSLQSRIKEGAAFATVKIDRGPITTYLLVNRNNQQVTPPGESPFLPILDGEYDTTTTILASIDIPNEKIRDERHVNVDMPDFPDIVPESFADLSQFDHQVVFDLISQDAKNTEISDRNRNNIAPQFNGRRAYTLETFQNNYPLEEGHTYRYQITQEMGQRIITVFDQPAEGESAKFYFQIRQEIPYTPVEIELNHLSDRQRGSTEFNLDNRLQVANILLILDRNIGNQIKLIQYTEAGDVLESTIQQSAIQTELSQVKGEKLSYKEITASDGTILIIIDSRYQGNEGRKYILIKEKPSGMEAPVSAVSRHETFENKLKKAKTNNIVITDLLLDNPKKPDRTVTKEVAKNRADALFNSLFEEKKQSRSILLSLRRSFDSDTDHEEEDYIPDTAQEIVDKYLAIRSYHDSLKTLTATQFLEKFWGVQIPPEFSKQSDAESLIVALQTALDKEFDTRAEKLFIAQCDHYIQETGKIILTDDCDDEEAKAIVNALGFTDAEYLAIILAFGNKALFVKEGIPHEIKTKFENEAIQKFASFLYDQYYPIITSTPEEDDLLGEESLSDLQENADLLRNAALKSPEVSILPNQITQAFNQIVALDDWIDDPSHKIENPDDRVVKGVKTIDKIANAIRAYQSKKTVDNLNVVLNFLKLSTTTDAIRAVTSKVRGFNDLSNSVSDFKKPLSKTAGEFLDNEQERTNQITGYYKSSRETVKGDVKSELRKRGVNLSLINDQEITLVETGLFKKSRKERKQTGDPHILTKIASAEAIRAITQVAEGRHQKVKDQYQEVTTAITGMKNSGVLEDWHNGIRISQVHWLKSRLTA